ncbi:MAG: hypothetical protein RL768_2644, partial [Nitrospirota bacterium]
MVVTTLSLLMMLNGTVQAEEG